jgi:hypothetical protein
VEEDIRNVRREECANSFNWDSNGGGNGSAKGWFKWLVASIISNCMGGP